MLGEIRKNKFGTPMKIIQYNTRDNIYIKFLDENGYETYTTYQNFKKGQIKNPYDRTVYGVGYIGNGCYKSKDENDRKTPEYTTWNNMIQRCYVEEYIKTHPAYGDCIIIDEWHNFQNFAKWYHENFYDVGEGRMHIDKDILMKGNRLYSPERCLIIPQRINMIFMNKPNSQGLPNGINKMKSGYRAMYNTKYLGIFKSVEEAINAHDTEMRIHIKSVTEDYGDKLPSKVRMALLNW